MTVLAILPSLFALAGSLEAQTQKLPPATVVIQDVQWVRTPDPEAVAQYMPDFAVMIGVSGRVTMRCQALFEGTPQNCNVVSAQPDGMGFGDAGKLVAATGIVRPRQVNGKSEAALFNFTVHFTADPIPAEPVELYHGAEPTPEALKLAREIVTSFPADVIDDPWLGTVEDLDSNRQSVVRGWLEALFPIDEEEEMRRTVLAMARLATEFDMKTFLATGVAPPQPTEEQYDAAFGGETRKSLRALQTLRSRYCARWSCEIIPDQ